MEIKNYEVDGLRHIEKIITHDNETFVEHYEEVVPMKLTKKISVKTVQMPVEEKIEIFNEDGTVETNIKSIPMETYNLVASQPKAKVKMTELPTIDEEDTSIDKTVLIQSIPLISTDKKEIISYILWAIVAISAALIIHKNFPL